MTMLPGKLQKRPERKQRRKNRPRVHIKCCLHASQQPHFALQLGHRLLASQRRRLNLMALLRSPTTGGRTMMMPGAKALYQQHPFWALLLGLLCALGLGVLKSFITPVSPRACCQGDLQLLQNMKYHLFSCCFGAEFGEVKSVHGLAAKVVHNCCKT